MAELVAGNFNQWSHDSARRKALEAAAQRAGSMQGFMGSQSPVRPEFDYAQQARDAQIKADTINQESSINSANNIIISGVNDAMEQQALANQAALDAQAAALASQYGEGTSQPRLGAYMRALRQSNDLGVDDKQDGQMGTYGMSTDVLQNKQGDDQGGWDRQALGRDISTEEFLNSRKLQTQIARYKFGKYLNKQGETGALTKWHQKSGQEPDSLQAFLTSFLSQLQR